MKRIIGAFAVGIFIAACGADATSLPGWSTGNGAGGGGSKDGGEPDPGGDDGGGPVTYDDAGNPIPPADGGVLPPGKDSGVTPPPPSSGNALAKNISITEVAMFQGVKISIASGGAKVSSRTANVVSNRDGLLRVYVTPGAGYTAKPITAELTLVSNGTKLPALTDTKTLSGASSDASMGSTFNFAIPGSSLPTGVTYSVALTDPATQGARATDPAQYPTTGVPEAMDTHSTGAQLKVVLVPFQYNADGSGRLPDTSAAQIEVYRQAMFSIYPAARVDVTVHAPFAFSSAISASGSGFSTALNALVSLRQQDGVPSDVYYMGIFAPSASFNSYCGGGCVTGLSGVGTNANDSTVRASAGIGFTGQESALTAAHEIGHAHGRQHAPCGGASGPDPSFPYAGGGIGVWGYNLVTKQLIDPASGKDLMGYCQPEWISDYNYQKLFTRMATVNNAPKILDPQAWTEPRQYRFLNIEADGSATWGQETILRERPLTDEHTVTHRAANGSIIATATGYYYAYGDLPGGFLLVPVPPAGTVSTTVAGSAVRATVRHSF